MTTYIDTYVACTDRGALEIFASGFTAHIPSQAGRVAQTVTNPDGTTTTIAAAGNPSLFYTCIRSTFDVTPYVVSPMVIVDAATGQAVCGVFV
ncbi:MAG: hypothetical protein KGI37_11220 [Alphaproteobacteria bacterium]|nr:hypothetical protein [Alphaproteobacteria bacterium]